jgi:hypothetical protein
LFWELQALVYLKILSEYALEKLGEWGVAIVLNDDGDNRYFHSTKFVEWDRSIDNLGRGTDYSPVPPLAVLTHELAHAIIEHRLDETGQFWTFDKKQNWAIAWENRARNLFWDNVPGYENQYPRPADFSNRAHRGDFGDDAWTVWNYHRPLPGYDGYYGKLWVP